MLFRSEGNGALPLDATDRFSTVTALLERGFPVTRAGAGRPVAPVDDTPVTVLGRYSEPPAQQFGEMPGLRWESLDGADPGAAIGRMEARRAELGVAQPGEDGIVRRRDRNIEPTRHLDHPRICPRLVEPARRHSLSHTPVP